MSKDKRKRPMNQQMAEAMILSRLYKDGFFVVDEEAKTVKVEMRRDKIVKLYKDSSYKDIRDIVERTVKGLKLAGYEVTVRWLSGASMSSQDKLEEIQHALEKPSIGEPSRLRDGFGEVSKN